MKRIIFLACTSMFLVACGSGSNNDNPATLTGVFLDSPVINADYTTQTQSGVTNSQGEYQYLAGEAVTFAIGDLEFPTVQAASTVTPLDMAKTRTITDESVVNMIRLLQSLDKDGIPTNGIEVTGDAKQASASVDFSQSTTAFEQAVKIINLVSNGGQDSSIGELITEDSAVSHFRTTLARDFPINLTQKTANSTMTNSTFGCSNVFGGWSYDFQDTIITQHGSDGWVSRNGNCALESIEKLVVDVDNLPSNFDTPFNCALYPICNSSDFNKTVTGVDEDDRDFTSTYSYNLDDGILTYIKSVEGGATYTETIKIDNQK